jgi:hypothetical protein
LFVELSKIQCRKTNFFPTGLSMTVAFLVDQKSVGLKLSDRLP